MDALRFNPRVDDVLPADLAALIPEDAPELVGVGWVSEWLGLTPPTIVGAIKAGRLPYLSIPGGKDKVAAYAVRPVDAARLWGRKILNRRAKETSD